MPLALKSMRAPKSVVLADVTAATTPILSNPGAVTGTRNGFTSQFMVLSRAAEANTSFQICKEQNLHLSLGPFSVSFLGQQEIIDSRPVLKVSCFSSSVVLYGRSGLLTNGVSGFSGMGIVEWWNGGIDFFYLFAFSSICLSTLCQFACFYFRQSCFQPDCVCC